MDNPVVWPTIRCKNSRLVIDFLVTAFGFREQFVVANEGGEGVLHAQLRWPSGGGVMLGDQILGDPFHLELPGGPSSVYVVTDEAGADIIRGLTDEGYGSRGFSAVDPEGNVWSFGTYTGE